MLELIPANPENPGFLLRCEHPTHGVCMIHVGAGTPGDIGAAMARCGTRPLDVSPAPTEPLTFPDNALLVEA